MAVEEKQALVLEQPKDQKVYLDLQHSTDTTAIWSFVIAMVVAFILGISATIIAIWYGRKSFELTKQSFDTLVKQIESSEKVTLDSSKELITGQSQNLLNQLRITNRFKELCDFREIAAEYYYWGIKVNNESIYSIHKYYNLKGNSLKCLELEEAVRVKVDELNSIISKLMLYLDYKKDSHNLVRKKLFEVQKSSFDVYVSIGTNYENSKVKLNAYGEAFGFTQGSLNNIIMEEIEELYKEKAA